jgi:nitroreductase
MKTNNLLTLIHERKSVRNFIAGKTISRDTLDTLVKAGMAAASAMNQQPWQFVVVDDRKILDALAEKLPYAKMLFTASAAVAVCGDTTVKVGERPFWNVDCAIASTNILLAAEALGLGAVWTAVHPDTDRIKNVQTTLNLPEHIVPLNVIPIGYPTGVDKPKDKYCSDKIHWNSW